MQRICRVLGHLRSKSKARALATTWTSECLFCRRRILRVKRGDWILLSEVHQRASDRFGPAFAYTWPVDQSYCFDELLQAIDQAIAPEPHSRPTVNTHTLA